MDLDPDPEEMRRLGHLAVDAVVAQLAALPQARVARRVAADAMAELLAEPLPWIGLGVEDSLTRFFDRILPHATRVNHPRFFAYIPGPGSYVGALGAWVAAATNLFTSTWLGGASMAQLELQTLGWLRAAVGLPDTFEGVLTTGGSIANLGALAAARSRLAEPERGAVYTSTEAHYSVAKAARILGFPASQIRSLPADASQRLDPAAVEHALAADQSFGLEPCAVVASAGTTSTGAIDPLEELADLAARERVWLHVDAAYGGAVGLLAEGRAQLAGLERADSVALDPHKWLYCPFECGCLLTRDIASLQAAFAAGAEYLQDVPRDEVNFFERGPELTRGNRALELWLLLRAVGVDAIGAAVRDDIRRCRLAHDALAADPRVEIVTPPQLSVFTFALRAGEAASHELVERIIEDGFLMLSSTRVHGRFAIRWCVLNHRTRDEDIESSVARVRALIG